MSERFKIVNPNKSKNTRLPIEQDFKNYRFNRDELAHISRYLYVAEQIINFSIERNQKLKILDIGCGEIYMARVLNKSFKIEKNKVIEKYTGFDIDYKTLQRAKSLNINSMNIQLICGDITTGGLLQFKDKSYDFVVCLETIEHIQPEYVKELLTQIKRIGKFGFISTPNFDGGSGKIPQDHIKEWRYQELKNIFDEVGIKIVKEIGIFCNLNMVKKLSKDNQLVEKNYNFMKSKMDSNFLSIYMAKIIGINSQNILKECVL